MAFKVPDESLEELMAKMKQQLDLTEASPSPPLSAATPGPSATPKRVQFHEPRPIVYATPPHHAQHYSPSFSPASANDDHLQTPQPVKQPSPRHASRPPRALASSTYHPLPPRSGWYFWSDVDKQEAHRRAREDSSLPYPPTAQDVWEASEADLDKSLSVDQMRTVGIRIFYYSSGGMKREDTELAEHDGGLKAEREDEVGHSWVGKQAFVESAEDAGDASKEDEYRRRVEDPYV